MWRWRSRIARPNAPPIAIKSICRDGNLFVPRALSLAGFHRQNLEHDMASAKRAAATVDDMHRDMQALRDDMAQLTTHVARLLGASGEEAVDEVKTRMRRMRDDIDEAVT